MAGKLTLLLLAVVVLAIATVDAERHGHRKRGCCVGKGGIKSYAGGRLGRGHKSYGEPSYEKKSSGNSSHGGPLHRKGYSRKHDLKSQMSAQLQEKVEENPNIDFGVKHNVHAHNIHEPKLATPRPQRRTHTLTTTQKPTQKPTPSPTNAPGYEDEAPTRGDSNPTELPEDGDGTAEEEEDEEDEDSTSDA